MRVAQKQQTSYYNKQKQLLQDLERQNAYMKSILTPEQEKQMNLTLWPNLYKNYYNHD